MTALELLETIASLQGLAEQVRRPGAVAPELKALWSNVERRLLLGLRAEERAASPAGVDPLRELKAIGANERIRNLVWEVSISFELQSPSAGALLKLLEQLRTRAQLQTPDHQLHPAA